MKPSRIALRRRHPWGLRPQHKEVVDGRHATLRALLCFYRFTHQLAENAAPIFAAERIVERRFHIFWHTEI